MKTLARALLAIAIVGCSQSALADETDRRTIAKKHYQRGKAAFELGKFAQALKEYETAYRMLDLPALLFNIGQCHRNLGSYEKAIFSFRLYLRKVPKARNRSAVETLVSELETKLEQRRADEQRRQELERQRRERERRRRELLRRKKKRRSTPIYKKWWFWTAVAAVVGGGVAGAYFGIRSRGPDLPSSPFPPWELP